MKNQAVIRLSLTVNHNITSVTNRRRNRNQKSGKVNGVYRHSCNF